MKMIKKIVTILVLCIAHKVYSQDLNGLKYNTYVKWVNSINLQVKKWENICHAKDDKFCSQLVKNIEVVIDSPISTDLTPRQSFIQYLSKHIDSLNIKNSYFVIEDYKFGDRNDISFFVIELSKIGSISHYKLKSDWQLLSYHGNIDTYIFNKLFLTRKTRKKQLYIDNEKIIVTKFSKSGIISNIAASVYNEDLNKWKSALVLLQSQ